MAVDFSDDFNRGDSTDLGANWVEATGNGEIESNTLRVVSGLSDLVTAADTSSADSYVQALQYTPGGGIMAFWIRATSDVQTGYVVNAYSSSAAIDIYRRVSGTFTQVGLRINTAVTDNKVTKITCETIDASTVRITIYSDGSEIGYRDDTNAARITSAGRCGVRWTNTSDYVDDFEMGTLGGEPPATAVKDIIGGGFIPFAR